MHLISHITFIVKNLEQSSLMFKSIFNAQEVYSSDSIQFSVHPERFFLIGNLWIAIMEDKSASLDKTYNHIAFKIEYDEIDDYIQRIENVNLKIEEGRSRIEGEGTSIYFYDYDNHLFELHTGTLNERLSKYNSFKK